MRAVKRCSENPRERELMRRRQHCGLAIGVHIVRTVCGWSGKRLLFPLRFCWRLSALRTCRSGAVLSLLGRNHSRRCCRQRRRYGVLGLPSAGGVAVRVISLSIRIVSPPVVVLLVIIANIEEAPCWLVTCVSVLLLRVFVHLSV